MRVAITSQSTNLHQVEFCLRTNQGDILLHTGHYRTWQAVLTETKHWLLKGTPPNLTDASDEQPSKADLAVSI